MTLTLGWVKGVGPDYARAVREGEVSMIEEEEGAIRRRARLEKLVLDTLGIEELRDYISELKYEIARVEADIDRKQGHRSAADAFFRRPGS